VNDAAKVLVVAVNFRHAECTLRFLGGASRLDGFTNCHLAIVDNNSGDDSVPRIRQAVSNFSNVELLASPQNRGYFGGAKWALEQYLAHHRVPDWAIVCNNDIVFDDPQFLVRLSERAPTAVGVIAPSIFAARTGHDANPCIRRRPTLLRTWRYRMLLSSYPVAWLAQWLSPSLRKARSNSSVLKQDGDSKAQIYAPHGSFIIFSRRFFEAGGFLDDGAFLYAEEFCVAEMCLRLGLPVIHDPELRVWHEEGETLGRMLTREAYEHQKRGLRYALARYKESYPELAAATTVTTTGGAGPAPQVSATGDST
jgi:GT2 family glycosyltransferase